MLFKDRKNAGELLAKALRKVNLKLGKGLVLGLPRGGVVVAAELARSFNLPLDVVITRKITAPGNPEFALAAVDENGVMVSDGEQLTHYKKFLKDDIDREIAEIKRRLLVYRGEEKHPDFLGKEVILVDDGIATGQTMISAIRFSKRRGAKKVYVAVPVLPADTIEEIADEVDGLFYLYAPESFWAVGQFYTNFPQVTDGEVKKSLRKAHDTISSVK